jgi:hypothetical protein
MYAIEAMLCQCHQYAPFYKETYHPIQNSPNIPEVRISLILDYAQDNRRHNLPNSNEVTTATPGSGLPTGDHRHSPPLNGR